MKKILLLISMFALVYNIQAQIPSTNVKPEPINKSNSNDKKDGKTSEVKKGKEDVKKEATGKNDVNKTAKHDKKNKKSRHSVKHKK